MPPLHIYNNNSDAVVKLYINNCIYMNIPVYTVYMLQYCTIFN